MENQIVLSSKSMSPSELHKNIIPFLESEISFAFEEKRNRTRSLDPTLLVALIGSTGAGIGILIKGLMDLAIAREMRTFLIEFKDGGKLQVPYNISEKRMKELVSILKVRETKQIILP